MDLASARQSTSRRDEVSGADLLEGGEAHERHPNFALDRWEHGNVAHASKLRIGEGEKVCEQRSTPG